MFGSPGRTRTSDLVANSYESVVALQAPRSDPFAPGRPRYGPGHLDALLDKESEGAGSPLEPSRTHQTQSRILIGRATIPAFHVGPISAPGWRRDA